MNKVKTNWDKRGIATAMLWRPIKNGPYWISYWLNDNRMRENTHSYDEIVANNLLVKRLVIADMPITEETASEYYDAVKAHCDSDIRPTKPGVVYLVSDGVFLKIGFSTEFGKRFRALRKAYGHNIELLATLYSRDARGAERLIHDEYKDYRLFGEWFLDAKCIREEWFWRGVTISP